MSDEVLFEKKHSVGIITLNRPEKLNAMNPSMGRELVSVLKEVQSDRDVRALVLTGSGRSFCSGGDVTNFPVGEEGQSAREDRQKKSDYSGQDNYFLAMRGCTKIIVGAINGYALGLGFGLALTCDIRIASEETRFAVLQLRRGIQPDGGLTYHLARQLGAQRALELTIRGAAGEMLGAAEALNLGLVAKVIPQDHLMEEACGLAERIAKGPTLAYGLAKEGIYKGIEDGFQESLAFEGRSIITCFASEDCAEGVRAFVEKREPVFKGK